MSKIFCLRCGNETVVTVQHITGTDGSITHKTAWRGCKRCGMEAYYNEEGELRLVRGSIETAKTDAELYETMPPFGTLLVLRDERISIDE